MSNFLGQHRTRQDRRRALVPSLAGHWRCIKVSQNKNAGVVSRDEEKDRTSGGHGSPEERRREARREACRGYYYYLLHAQRTSLAVI